jgi:hypothetical protein
MIKSFFDVTPVELGQLGSEPAVAVLREMLWAEVHNLGIPITEVDVPFAVTTSDGGVDAVITGQPTGSGNGLVFPPRTSYQVKAGDYQLTATRPGEIEKLLIIPSAIADRVKSKAPPSGQAYKTDQISPRIRNCLDGGGTFVTMLFGNDGIDTEEDATEKAIQKFLGEIDNKYADAKVKVWRQSSICGLLRQFPAVALLIKNIPGFQLLNHQQWADRFEMTPEFVAAPDQQAIIDSLRETLRHDSQGSVHVRLLGEPGIGKTRLVLEALRADDLQSITLYADKATKVDGSVISAISSARHAHIILVVDECGPDARSELVRSFRAQGPAIKVLSIYQDRDETDSASEYRLFDVPPLPEAEIKQILETYGVDPATVDGWAALCEGSPRVAHVIGQNLRDHPDDPLRSDGTAQIWVRFLAADVDRKSKEYRERHLVLSSLALFKKFGWGAPVRTAAHEVYRLIISELDSGLSKASFAGIIEQMAARKVLQGDNFLYITPRALHIKLWIDWWNQHGASIDVNKLVPELTPAMRQWFAEMIEYAASTPVSKRLVENLLGQDGLYKDAEWLNTKEGGRFFFSLSVADPPGAVRRLEQTIGKMDRETLLQLEEGRRDIIWALEGIAVHGELFKPAAKLLLALAEAENETWSNNATGVFAGLFSLGYGQVAPTALAPEHRLPVLLAALKSTESRAEIALKAFDTALETASIVRSGNEQPFRLRKQVVRWSPKTYGEWFDAFRLYWRALRENLPPMTASMQRKAAGILIGQSRGLFQIESLREEIIETLEELAANPVIDRRKVIAGVEFILEYDSDELPQEVVSRLRRFLEHLVGSSFHARLQRFAGMELSDKELAEDGKSESRTIDIIRELAQEALNDLEKFRPELSWLVTSDARNGYRFGYELAQLDVQLSAWPAIEASFHESGPAADDFFLGGYLRAVFERDRTRWEGLLSKLTAHMSRPEVLPRLVWRSGISEAMAALILEWAQDGKIQPKSLEIFSGGRATAGLSDAAFGKWLSYLVNVGTLSAATTATHLASMSLHGGRALTSDQLKALVTQPILLQRAERRAESVRAYDWVRLSRALAKLDESAEPLILRSLLTSLGNSGAITEAPGRETASYLDELVARHPTETWRIVSDYIKPPLDGRGFTITRWFRGDSGFHERNTGLMRHIPRVEVWDWVALDPQRRAAYLASMAPKDFTTEDWKGSLIREVLCRYGDSDSVRSAVFANFFTGAWAGPASAHYMSEKGTLEELKATETDPNALRWLGEAIGDLERQIEAAKIEEEARGY